MTNELDVPSTAMLAKLHEEHAALQIEFKIVSLHTPVREMLDASKLTAWLTPPNTWQRYPPMISKPS
jgi:hypothetical protein